LEREIRQAQVVSNWLSELGNRDLDIIDVGCGAGWFCPELVQFGRVTATDLSDKVLERAKRRVPAAKFVAGDFMILDFGVEAFDVAVSLEVLAHVPDQAAFLSKISSLLRPGGYLMLATQNRDVLERYNDVPPPKPGQLRRWVNSRELLELLSPEFEVLELFTVTPLANRGFMRLVNSYKLNQLIRRLEHRIE
jgi:SAM-dependent methyltransferase